MVLTQPPDRRADTLTDHAASQPLPQASRADDEKRGSQRPFHRSRARLTSSGPGIKHHTRRLVSCGAHTAARSTSGHADRPPPHLNRCPKRLEPTTREEGSQRPFHRSRARLTSSGPGIKHHTRRLVSCGAHTAARSTSGHADRPPPHLNRCPKRLEPTTREEGSQRPFHRSRARLTSSGPGIKHHTRRLVSCGAHTAARSTSGHADRSP